MAAIATNWRNQLSDRMLSLNLSQSVIATLVGIPPNRISGYFSARLELGGDELRDIYALLTKCEKLSGLVAPLVLDWKKIDGVRAAIRALDDGELRSVFVSQEISAATPANAA